jgi:hypothetical protein
MPECYDAELERLGFIRRTETGGRTVMSDKPVERELAEAREDIESLRSGVDKQIASADARIRELEDFLGHIEDTLRSTAEQVGIPFNQVGTILDLGRLVLSLRERIGHMVASSIHLTGHHFDARTDFGIGSNP